MWFTSSKSIYDKVILAVEQTVYVQGDAVSPATRLVDDLQLGRLGRIRLAMYLEEAFDLEISDDAVEYFDTIGDITLYLSRWSLENVDLSPQSWLTA